MKEVWKCEILITIKFAELLLWISSRNQDQTILKDFDLQSPVNVFVSGYFLNPCQAIQMQEPVITVHTLKGRRVWQERRWWPEKAGKKLGNIEILNAINDFGTAIQKEWKTRRQEEACRVDIHVFHFLKRSKLNIIMQKLDFLSINLVSQGLSSSGC